MPLAARIFLLVATRAMLGRCADLKTHSELQSSDPSLFEAHCPDVDPMAGLHFSQASLSYSNLGGHGPDTDMQTGMYFTDVFPSSPGIDMKIEIPPDSENYYAPAPKDNRMYNEFFGINVEQGTTTLVKVTFLKDGEPAKTPSFVFTVASLDAEHGAGGAKAVRMTGAVASRYGTSTLLYEHSAGPSSSWVYTGAKGDQREPLPTHAFAMDEALDQNSVAFLFPAETQEFFMDLKVFAGRNSRTFAFTGSSNIVCGKRALCNSHHCPAFFERKDTAADIYCAGEECTQADDSTCCQAWVPDACSEADTLMFPPDCVVHSNLGGLGPDFDKPESLLYNNVFPASGEMVLLNITTRGPYEASKPSKNGEEGAFGVVNIRTGTKVDLDFAFIDIHGQPVELNHAYWITIYDFDQQKDGGGKEKVTVGGYEKYKLSSDPAILVRQEPGGGTSFIATEYGNESDNPLNPKDLLPHQWAKTVAIKFATGSTNFSMSLEAAPGFGGRNFEFTGFSGLPCPQQALCDTMACPNDSLLISEANRTYCGGGICNEADVSTCCRATGGVGAACSTLSCPVNMTHRDGAFEIGCAEEVCGDADITTCCEVDNRQYCSPEHSLVFSKAEVSYDDAGETKEIKYYDVFPGREGEALDMVVKLKGDRSAVRNMSGTQGSLGRIELNGPATLDLDFKIHRSSNGRRVETLSPFFFSLVDFAIATEEDGGSYIKFENLITDASPTLAGNTLLDVNHNNLTIRRRKYTINNVNATPSSMPMILHPQSIPRSQMLSTVTMLIAQTKFKMKLVVEKPTVADFALLFAGSTNLVCPVKASCATMTCPVGYILRGNASSRVCYGEVCNSDDAPHCCTCGESSALKFRSDGLVESSVADDPGAEEGRLRMLLEDVFPGSSRMVDMEVTSTTPYTPYNTSHNYMNGEFLSVNIKSGTSVGLKFKFIDHSTNDPVIVDPFFFSAFDLDEQSDGGAQESIFIDRHFWSKVSMGNTVLDNDGKFVGTHNGDWLDNPSNALALRDEHTKESISFLMNATAEFDILISAGNGWTGRNFLFAGNSVITCDRKALCSSFICPPTFVHRMEADRMVCNADRCEADVDIARCCVSRRGPRSRKRQGLRGSRRVSASSSA